MVRNQDDNQSTAQDFAEQQGPSIGEEPTSEKIEPVIEAPESAQPVLEEPEPPQPPEADEPSRQPSGKSRRQAPPYEGQDLLEHMLKWLGHESVPPGLVSILHSLIFASDKPLTVASLKKLLDAPDGKMLRSALRALQDIHRQMGVQLVEVAGGYQFRTNPEHSRWVKRLVPEKPVRLSRAALEVLAVIAYRQPVTRAEIEDVRGVDCGGVLRSLLERSLIKIMGRKPEPGRPLLYGTSKEFLSFFGLKGLKDLPSLRDLDALEDEQGTAQEAKADQTVDSVLADDLAELIAEQDSPGIEDDPVLEKALEDARQAAKQANKTFKNLKQREKALQSEEEQRSQSGTEAGPPDDPSADQAGAPDQTVDLQSPDPKDMS